MGTSETFKELYALAEEMGTVKSAHLYNYGYLTVHGEMENGEEFTLTLDIKEAKEND